MKITNLLWISVLAALPSAAAGPAKELFNHRNLEGWEMIRSQGHDTFTVEDGVMKTTGSKGMAIYAREKIGNGTVHVVYKMSNPKGNSGVFIRIPEVAKTESYAINHGIEVQIDNNDNDWHCTGVLYSMTKAKARPYKPTGEWNTMDITMEGPRTIVRLNGVLVTDYDGVSPVPPKTKSYEPDRGPRPDTGYLGVQGHDNQAVIYFKEITFTPNGR